jgi:hypothetical protein
VVHIDTLGQLDFELSGSVGFVRLPLSGEPDEPWRRAFDSLSNTRDYRLYTDGSGKTYVQVLIANSSTGQGADLTALLEHAFQLVDQVDRRVAESVGDWERVRSQVQGWWDERT